MFNAHLLLRNRNWKTGIISSFVLFILVLTVYLLTLCPTVGIIDTGEFITGARYLNILHPTGYPLYLILTRVFSFIPLGNLAVRINFLSAFLSSLSAVFLFLFLQRIHRDLTISLLISLLYAFSNILWQVSNEAEVYSLTALFITLIIYLISRMEERNFLFLIAFLFGLSLTNHMMIVGLFVSFLVFHFFTYRVKDSRYIPCALLFFFFGLSLYSFLLIRSSLNPLINWGNPRDFTRLLWHITGKQYQVWMFSSSLSEIGRNIANGFEILVRNLIFIFVPSVFWGVVLAFKKEKGLSFIFLSSLLISFFYAANYSIPDIQPYYLPSFLALLFFLSFGLKEIAKFLRRRNFLLLLFSPLPIIFNYSESNKRDYYIGYDFAQNVFASAPANSIIITNWWDFYAPSLYLQHIENKRKDLTIVDKELMRRSWYFSYLEKAYPWLLKNSQSELTDFFPYLYDFEYDRLKDNIGIQNSFIRLIRSFIEKNPERRHFFIFLPSRDYDLPFIIEDKTIVPYGILYEIRDDTVYEPFDYRRLTLRLPAKRLDEREKIIINHYRLTARARGEYLDRIGVKTKDAAQEKEGLEEWLKKLRLVNF